MEVTSEKRALRLLSIDGGGIRGLSALLILRRMMHLVQMDNELQTMPRPCEYFDMMAGTSTGGLIVLMLGRLRMSVQEAISAYEKLAEQVFADVKRNTGDGKFKASKLEDAIKGIVKTKTGHPEAPLLDESASGCKTFVCAMNARNMNARIPVHFRTYLSPDEEAMDCTIWEAARSTSAAPTFFKRMSIRGQDYIDGGMGNNNPTQLLLTEARRVFRDNDVACVISLGTGKGDTINIPEPGFIQRNILPVDAIKAIQNIATDCEHTHEEMSRHFLSTRDIYFRLNVEQGLQKVSLSDWERLPDVEAHTKQYLAQEDVKQRLKRAAKALYEQGTVIPTGRLDTLGDDSLR